MYTTANRMPSVTTLNLACNLLYLKTNVEIMTVISNELRSIIVYIFDQFGATCIDLAHGYRDMPALDNFKCKQLIYQNDSAWQHVGINLIRRKKAATSFA
ncbi:MAG: hypothetical protein ACXW03_08865 [Methylobacter sp.]